MRISGGADELGTRAQRPRPDFLGIGVVRCGTTWLHELLDAHPDVAMPTRRKELDFFNVHYQRGQDWYSASFDKSTRALVRVGEISPRYLDSDDVRARVRAFGGINQFIVCLRDPVARMWSQYRYFCTTYGYNGSIEQYFEERPESKARGLYAQNLKPWFDDFGQQQFLLLRLDAIRGDPVGVRRQVAHFLDIDERRFTGLPASQVNSSFAPRFPRLYQAAKSAARRLHDGNASWIVNLAKRTNIDHRISTAQPVSERTKIPAPVREHLERFYAADLRQLEEMTGISLPPEL